MYTLKQLTDKAYKELLDSGLSDKTIYSANWYIWNRLIRLYGNDAIFEEVMCHKYCKDYFGRDIFKMDFKNLLKVEQSYVRAFNRLIQSNMDEPFDKFEHYHRDFKLDLLSQSLLDDYLQKCKEDGNSSRTLANKQKRIRNFLVDVDFKTITKESALAYIKSRRQVMINVSYTIEMNLIRRFLVFCYERGQLDKPILMIWPYKMVNTVNKTIPSTYSLDEISQLIESAKTFTREDNHYRNYAILCLIAYTGMRANDVVHLTPNNFNWRNNTIQFIQQKTKKEQMYPLLPQVGNPIIDYIKNERPKGKFLFLTENGRQLCTQIITSLINSYFIHSKININGRHYGAHALRHSIATNMINSGVSMFSVANTLGHSSIESVKIYGKVDITHLRKCVLEAPYYA